MQAPLSNSCVCTENYKDPALPDTLSAMTTYRYETVNNCPMCLSSQQRVLGQRMNRRQGLRPSRLAGITTTIVRCRECGLTFANPKPLPENLGDHYDTAPEEYWETDYFEQTDEFDGYAAKYRELNPAIQTPRVLDVGCGLGHNLRAMTARGFDAYGLEPSPAFRDRAIADGVAADRIFLASAEDADLDSNQFDLVFMSAVLEHLPDPSVALRRALGWLKPGGMIFVAVPSSKWLMGRLLNATYKVRGLDYVTNLSPMHPPYHLWEFTPESFQKHGVSSGYDVAAKRVVVCDPFVPEPLGKLAYKLMDRTGTGMILEVWLKKQ